MKDRKERLRLTCNVAAMQAFDGHDREQRVREEHPEMHRTSQTRFASIDKGWRETWTAASQG